MYICGRLSEVEEGAGSPLLLFLTDMCMIEKKVVSQLIEEKLASSSNYLVDVVIKPGNLIVVEIDNDEAVSIDDCGIWRSIWIVTSRIMSWRLAPPALLLLSRYFANTSRTSETRWRCC